LANSPERMLRSMPEPELFAEANRQLTICNACRYCEGLCPVFPAMEIRKSFTQNDIRYLANLCHDCRACQQACMFTAPHEFAISFPRIMSEVRMESYEHWSWPGFLAKSFSTTSKGMLLGLATLGAVFALACFLTPANSLLVAHPGPGSFYQVVSYISMIVPALLLTFYGAMIWLQGGLRFWIDGNDADGKGRSMGAALRALRDSLTLRYLSGGGPGCAYPGQTPNQLRRIFHTLTVAGFFADLISTTLAFIYQDFLHRLPPYALTSLPVLFGTVGGIALVAGTSGLIVFKAMSDRTQAADNAYGLDYAFLLFLGLAGFSGLVLLTFRSTAAMGLLLILHLSIVAALFVTAPYGKFVHFVYRVFALLRFQVESHGAQPQGGH
jgi:citrate/tricarballylate utilization protein